MKQIFIPLCLLILILIESCTCDEKAAFQIVRGTLTVEECAELQKRENIDIDDAPNTSVICPGEPCTICYAKTSNLNQIKISSDDSSIDETTSSDAGAINFVPEKTTKITLEPIASCAKNIEGTVYVLTEAMAVPITGSWDANLIGQNNCSDVVFNLSETFVSPNIFAIEVMADWDEDKRKEAVNGEDCPTPPFLNVFRPGNPAAGFHKLPMPQQWENLPRGWSAVGEWAFVPEFIEECGVRKNCDLRIDFPFFLYLSCNENEPYRQP